jgi:transcriptional regulator with XRE-family HTH domain
MADSPLAAWLTKNDVSHAELGRRLGVTDSAVWRWAHDQRRPGVDDAFKIEKATAGAVPASSWRARPKKKAGKTRRAASRRAAARVVRGDDHPRD